jgi:PAS domain S-box-containing protein
MTQMLDDTVAELQRDNAELRRKLDEALARETAAAEVLEVINSSPGDLAPVFEAILEKATSLCEATFGVLSRIEGDQFHAAAFHCVPPAFAESMRQPRQIMPGNAHYRLMQGEEVVQVEDVTAEDVYRSGNPARRSLADLGGARTVLWVALRKDNALFGAFVIYRQEVRPFSDKQIALVQNFAAQAVIAMENTRLITETREALEQQTASAEVLQVINSSPGDLTPVFDAMLDKALRLCDAAFGHLLTFDGERFDTAAMRGEPSLVEHLGRRGPFRLTLDDASLLGRIIVGGEHIVQTADVLETDEYRTEPPFREMVDIGGYRSLLDVALRKENVLFGVIVIFRKEVRLFSDKQIALLQNFAAQAVIAMENARLITETREALDQQTATAEILRVISGSATDIQPVFEAIVERAIKLCEAEFTAVARFDDGLLQLVATSNLSSEEAAAFHSLFPRPPNRGFVMGRAFVESRPVNVEDVLSDPDYDQRTREILQSLTRSRSFLGVPIMREGKAIGVIGCARREVRAFTAAQIELVSTFADQAVIAIENARLLGELRDREAELRTTFDSMADGFVMFDEKLRLAAWNRNFQELLDLPDALLTARPSYADYLRILAERGEFGTDDIEAELSRRLEETDQELRLERTRPDGRVIEVRRNSVPDGGFVLIYSDITERKRSEAEIRAARDAPKQPFATLEQRRRI